MEQAIFQKGSTTYYWSSKFFPETIRQDVFRFYSFVRVVDDYVDQPVSDVKAFNRVRQLWTGAIVNNGFSVEPATDDTVDMRVVKNIVYIVRKYDCPREWVESFFDSMQMDIDHKSYKTVDEVLAYIYGSAEVIGLFMSKIMGLPEESFESAKMQGRAMQYVNFIRDIKEDNELGRQYIPKDDLVACGLKSLSRRDIEDNPEQFKQCMMMQIERYRDWQKQANTGFRYIPRRLRIPLRTAVDMYNWTAKKIEQDPLSVLDRKVKPSKWRVVLTALKRGLWV